MTPEHRTIWPSLTKPGEWRGQVKDVDGKIRRKLARFLSQVEAEGWLNAVDGKKRGAECPLTSHLSSGQPACWHIPMRRNAEILPHPSFGTIAYSRRAVS